MSKVAIIAKITALEGKRAELAEAMQVALANADGEPGTEKYILHEDGADPNLLWMYEIYTDGDALAAHGSSDAFKAFGKSIGHLVGGRPEITILNPIGGKGL